jgi:hypothetical protein
MPHVYIIPCEISGQSLLRVSLNKFVSLMRTQHQKDKRNDFVRGSAPSQYRILHSIFEILSFYGPQRV